ncbi:MAG: type II secretion system F family protein, partial [Vulcanococcus sp.]
MPTYTATYTTRSGQSRQLKLQASDVTAARRDLRKRGIVPAVLEASESSPQAKPLFSADLTALLEAKPGIREKALFANKLAALVDA